MSLLQISKENMLERQMARLGKEFQNSGFDVDINTLTGIKARVTEQKFYEVMPSDFLPVEVGQNAWAVDSLTYLSTSTGSDFATGIIETGTNSGRIESADTQIDSVIVPRKVWAKSTNYNIPELMQAQVSGNWSLVERKEEARYKNWQLGVQNVAFLGLGDGSTVKGLLTQNNVTVNTSVITKTISSMTSTEFNTFLSTVIPAYYANTGSTVLPTHFVMPMADYLGLGSAVDEAFPLKSRLERLNEAFKTYVPEFVIKGLAYADSANNALGVSRYTMYRGNDASSLTMEIPVDYTTTIYDTINGFNYQSVGYGQFAGVQAYRPKEMMYFDF
tara:strand:+ start:1214 stop:2206 length:993 start_codon:yes stop_codon:yes gene_type:complete